MIEVGSRDINGSLRSIIESMGPIEYVGVDAVPGPGVDRVCEVDNIARLFGENSFDLVVSTEVLEHVRNWRSAVSTLKAVCKRNGLLILTTRSVGFPYHGYPSDFWRYEPEDLQEIFSDMEILEIERDRKAVPGVFAKIRKPADFEERSTSNYQLYSIIAGGRVVDITPRDIRRFMLLRSISKRLTVLATKLGDAI